MDEMVDVQQMAFRFANKTDPIEYTEQLSTAMHKYSVEDIVSGGTLIFDVDLQSTFSKYLPLMVPRNCITILSHKGLAGKTALKERWYGTDYDIEPFSDHLLHRWEQCLRSGGRVEEVTLQLSAGDASLAELLRLPERNMFIATDFNLRSEPGKSKDCKMIR
jgi:secreted Zn-dependent insulinase-like peptidase